jgi:protein SCO1/2
MLQDTAPGAAGASSASSADRGSWLRATWPLLIVIVVALVAPGVGVVWHVFAPPKNYAPDFTLVDQDARPFTLSAQRGHPMVLFFGYTHCPDACPLTLAHLARALRSTEVPRDARVAFITVDPFRDTPAAMKRYVDIYRLNFIGLTGSLSALQPVYDAYHTWRQAVPATHGPSNYSMAHGTAIYYIGRDGSLKGFGNWDDPISSIVHDLKEFQ